MPSDAQLATQLHAQLSELTTMALGCPRGGGGAWDDKLESLGVTGLEDAERERHLREGAPLAKGPLPLEFRWALERLARPYEAKFDDTGRAPAMIAELLRAYIKAVKPAPSTSSIFATALATTKTYADTAAGADTLCCSTCGAPRMDGDERLKCMYCGSEAFG